MKLKIIIVPIAQNYESSKRDKEELMVKITKKKKRRTFRLGRFTLVVFSICVGLYLAASLFLRSYNNSLSTRIQEIETQIAAIELQNDAVRVEISQLSSADRVDEIAANNGLTNNQDNVVTITESDSEDGE